jgi:tyrosine-protein phosphatase OCA6
MEDQLPPLVPPLRYSLVEEGVYRGAYPSRINLRFLTRLGLRSMVSLLPEPPAPHLLRWCDEHGVRNHYERVAPFQREVTLTHERIAELLQLLVLPDRQPVYVHCLDGIGVTGALIMGLRKLQRWMPPSVIAEYACFARAPGTDAPTPPASHVLSFFHAFKPELELARLLPPLLPAWLDAALNEGGPLGDGPGAPHAPSAAPTRGVDGGDSRTFVQEEAGQLREAEHAGATPWRRRHANANADGGGAAASMRVSAGPAVVSSGLDALAIEGLTMGPTRSSIRAALADGRPPRLLDAPGPSAAGTANDADGVASRSQHQR